MSYKNALNGWDGYSRNGQAAYDELFEQEMAEADGINPDMFYEGEGAKPFVAQAIDKKTGEQKTITVWAYPAEPVGFIIKNWNSNLLATTTLLAVLK